VSKQGNIVFIINPIAGNGLGEKLKREMQGLTQRLPATRVSIVVSNYKAHASELAAEYVRKNYDIVVAVGGDGTVNEVASAIMGSATLLGIIPLGSGNGLARHLGIPRNYKKALRLILEGRIKAMDIGIINGRYFFCTCGVGFDARVGAVFADSSGRGFKTYLRSTMSELLNYQVQKYTLSIDNQRHTEKAFLITFANASQYGNNVFIAPKASTSDGLVDVSVIKPFPIFRVFGLSIRLFTKQIHRSKFMSFYRGKEIILKREHEGEVHIDGETYQMGKKIKIGIPPEKLRVIVPY
jgi:diacylglycerol kinase (ATP)